MLLELSQQTNDATGGEAFSFSTSFLQGDALPTSAASTGSVPNFGSITSYASGTAGDLAGTIKTDGAITLTAGGVLHKCCQSIRKRNHGY